MDTNKTGCDTSDYHSLFYDGGKPISTIVKQTSTIVKFWKLKLKNTQQYVTMCIVEGLGQ